MKKLIYLLSLILLVSMSCSKDEPQVENEVANEISALDLERIPFIIQMENAKLNENGVYSKTSSEKENNGKGVYIVPFYSDDGIQWSGQFPIYDKDENLTHVLFVDFPPNGEDTALVFSETEMMVNFTSHGPKMLLFEIGVGFTYANYCDEVRDGIYKGRIKTGYVAVDRFPEDGITDFYFWGPNAPVEGDKNGIFNIKATLSSIQGACRNSTIDFSYIFQLSNGEVRQTSSLY